MEEKKQETVAKSDAAQPATFRQLLSYADALDWVLMSLGTLGSAVHGMAQPVGYLLLGKALDAFGNNIDDRPAMVEAMRKVLPFVWYMAIATLPAGMPEIACWMYSSERQAARLRLAFLRAVLSQDIATFDTDLTSGKIITGVTSHMSMIQDAIGEKLGHFISSFSTFFAGVIIAFVCCWQVALLTFLILPLILLIGATYSKHMNALSRAKMGYLSEATSIVEQTTSQIKTVYAFVGETSAIKSFKSCMEKLFTLSKIEATVKGVGLGMFQAVTFCSWALMVWVGAVVVTDRKSTGGDTLAAVMSILFGAISVTYAAPDFQVFNQAKVAGSEVFCIIQRKPVTSYENKGKSLERILGDIDIREVHFAYPSRPEKEILQGFSLSIPAGKVAAFVGSSGCGKSTVLSLVARFYDPLKGDVFIDRHNVKDLDLRFLRKNIGIVLQEPSLFAGTIKDNLKVGNQNANDEQIIRATSNANVHTFISQLPQQYSSQVGERGVQLSGGQKQRIAIARAVLKDPPILLLDEATSALDSESEKLVQDALDISMKGRTVILIAHRMSTIVNADIIAVVDDGKVQDTGTHSELLETSNLYRNLCNMQNLNKDTEVKETNARKGHHTEELEAFSPGSSAQASEWSITVLRDLIGNLDTQHQDPVVKESENIRRRTVPFRRIWFRLEKLDIAKAAFGSCAAALSGISKPMFGYFIMTIGVAYYKTDARRRVGWYSVAFSLIGMLTLASHILQHYFYGIIGETAMRNLRETIFSVVLHNEIAWFEKPENGIGYLTSRIVSDTSMIKTIISDKMSVIVQCISSILIATIVSMVVNWRMALVAWAVMPCHFIGGLVQAKSAQGFSGDMAIAHQEIASLATEAASNIKTVASFVYEDEILNKVRTSLKEPIRKSRIQSVKYGIIQGVSLCLWNVAHAVALWYTIILVEKNQATFENGIRSYQIFSLTVPSITELWTLIPTVLSAISVLTPSYKTLDRRTEIDPDVPQEFEEERLTGKIKFKNITFSYPSRPDILILNRFNLSIEAGKMVALVGPSGAGKSSIIALLLRYYDPQEGRIVIDKKSTKEYNLKWLRRQIGLVLQEPLLFSCSIRENICYGTESASEAEVVEAAINANIHEFVSRLPNGYDTVVGEKGCQLSGGQKQRIAIARTLLKRPTILLLDEATSALDGESERVVMDALASFRNRRRQHGTVTTCTQITVAHRLSTIVNSDVIVVMDKGEIVEKGEHSTLVTKEGVYSRLYHLQNVAD